MENLKNMKIPKMPPGAGAGLPLAGLLAAGAAGLYGLSNCLFNVEGGHRAIVFNRFVGIKEKVGSEHGRRRRHAQRTLSQTTHDRSMCTKRKRAAAGIPAFLPHRI